MKLKKLSSKIIIKIFCDALEYVVNFFWYFNRKYDLNNSGAITADELQVVLSKMYRFYTREQCQELIRRVDKNRDGLIQIDEFADLLELE